MNKIRNFIDDENGLETVEWAVMAALITLGLVGAISALGAVVLSRFQILENATRGS
jgi:Flp pilus assembly pilin Flp